MHYSQDNTKIKLIRKPQKNKEKKKLFDVSFELFWAPLVLVMCSMLYNLNIYGLFYRSVSKISLRIKGSEKVQDIGGRGLHGILDLDYVRLWTVLH